ncbi:hypothetical protein SBOR_7992 [Sclerotinia borealis F-4128]|uniref:Uncharacterized protein n=1 Tax=Sclerotinia borealis (strain F-4128) TaxID=1432307 RepID=W9CAM7_SCLBF|nr:hypothetical protein SBOR_7992 [Sclerotinia borealis F-4128]
MSLRRPSHSASSSNNFRFLDLPSEIRTKIYGLVLCDIRDLKTPDSFAEPTEFAKYEHDIHPQLLQTCHQINDEAKYTMLTTNLFVEVKFITGIGHRLNYDFFEMLRLARVPILRVKKNEEVGPHTAAGGAFNGCVMRHQISSAGGSIWEKKGTDSLMLLHRDMDQFCAAIMETQWFVTYINEKTIHEVTLLNPFIPEVTPSKVVLSGKNTSARPFSMDLLRHIQPTLLSPFTPQLFRGSSGFIIKDHTIKNRPAPSVMETTTLPMTAVSVMEDLYQLKGQGDNHSLQGSHGYAKAFYKLIDYKIAILMRRTSLSMMKLFEEEGNQLEKELADLSTELSDYKF